MRPTNARSYDPDVPEPGAREQLRESTTDERSPSEHHGTDAAFHAEVTSAEFWAAVDQRRAAANTAESLRIDGEYRRQRAEAAAAELRP